VGPDADTVNPYVTKQYKDIGDHLDDDILRQAENNLKPQWDQNTNLNAPDYVLMCHNCHNYTDAVIHEYNRTKNMQNSTQSPSPCK